MMIFDFVVVVTQPEGLYLCLFVAPNLEFFLFASFVVRRLKAPAVMLC